MDPTNIPIRWGPRDRWIGLSRQWDVGSWEWRKLRNWPEGRRLRSRERRYVEEAENRKSCREDNRAGTRALGILHRPMGSQSKEGLGAKMAHSRLMAQVRVVTAPPHDFRLRRHDWSCNRTVSTWLCYSSSIEQIFSSVCDIYSLSIYAWCSYMKRNTGFV